MVVIFKYKKVQWVYMQNVRTVDVHPLNIYNAFCMALYMQSYNGFI